MGSDPQSMLSQAHEDSKKLIRDEKSVRTCENCACSHKMKHPQFVNESQLFCRREPPIYQRLRVMQPVIRNGNPVMQKGTTDKPLLESVEGDFYVYKPTVASMVCFDGWRPIGTEAGDFRYKTPELDKMREGMSKFLEHLAAPTDADLQALIDAQSKKN